MSFELIKHGTKIDFIGKRRICAIISVVMVVASIVATIVDGVKMGIDFAGGTEIQLTFEPQVEVDEGHIRDVVGSIEGIDELSVIRYGEPVDNEFLVKFKGTVKSGDASEGKDKVEAVETAVKSGIGALRDGKASRVEFVGPKVGEELRDDGLAALFYASLVVLIYIAFRFTSRFAPGAILAVIHDLIITAGIFVMLGLEFDLRILAAMLAILGYSLNDTIIIYDRVRENLELHTKHDLAEVLNLSVNQTLSRTVLTSGTTLLAVGALYFLGGEVIRPFAFAMMLGVMVGTYSSIYIAAPTLLLLESWLGKSESPKRA